MGRDQPAPEHLLLNEHYDHRVVDLREGVGRRPDRGGRATHVAIKRLAAKLTASGDSMVVIRSSCDGR
jgi:hypothetical protein